MPRTLFAQQNAESDRVLLRELNNIMEAHLASGCVTAEKSRTETAAEDFSEREQGQEQPSCGEEGEGRRYAAAFKAKMLRSSRQIGGKSMLYHGTL